MNRGKRGPCKEIWGSPNFKSTYERNVYRVLRCLGSVEYEPGEYKFEPPYRRCLGYSPDFMLTDKNGTTIFEVKGWLDGPSKTRLSGFKKHYPGMIGRFVVVTTGKNNIEWLRLNIGCEIWDYSKLKQQSSALGLEWE